jgi:hypothetical protein
VCAATAARTATVARMAASAPIRSLHLIKSISKWLSHQIWLPSLTDPDSGRVAPPARQGCAGRRVRCPPRERA